MEVDSNLSHYIATLQQGGVSPDLIKQNLVNGGWDAAQVDAALTELGQGTSPILTTPPTADTSKTNNGVTVGTIIALILSPLIGLIVMWTLTKWPKKTKWIVTALTLVFVIVVPAIILVVMYFTVFSNYQPSSYEVTPLMDSDGVTIEGDFEQFNQQYLEN